MRAVRQGWRTSKGGQRRVDGFNFMFSLFGLLLGLALAEGLGGLSRAIKASHKVRIGYPTALLGIFVSCDVVTFWMYGWTLRNVLPVTWPVLFCGFVITGVYYVSTSLIFPGEPEEWGDLDAHFVKHGRKVLVGVALCNVALLAATIGLFGMLPLTWRTAVVTWSFFPVSLLAILAWRRRPVVLACLVWLIALYPLSVFW
ncbi:hypothetical protein [Sphingomonas sp. VNH70]|uniref:hypothetical protein n=1 Tax=Sphingomonas silueang TaxID=3156617 RepID=UPI0032B41DC8